MLTEEDGRTTTLKGTLNPHFMIDIDTYANTQIYMHGLRENVHVGCVDVLYMSGLGNLACYPLYVHVINLFISCTIHYIYTIVEVFMFVPTLRYTFSS